jgi:hypothetical protein
MMLMQRQLAVRAPRRRSRLSLRAACLRDLVAGRAIATRLASRQLTAHPRPARPEPGYADSFFADPVAVEDDYRRLRRGQ